MKRFNVNSVKKSARIILTVFVMIVMVSVLTVVSASNAGEPATAANAGSSANVSGLSMGSGIGLLAAALVTSVSGIGGGIAVASSASAAIGAISENPKVFGQALIFVALAEGIALYGLLISMQILSKI